MATFISQTGTYEALLFGGATTVGNAALADTWIWNGTAWSQLSSAGPQPPARSSATMAWDLTNNTIVLFGGKDGAGPPNNLSDTWIFDTTTLSWSQGAACATPGCSPSARRQAAMSGDVANNGVLLFGGTNSTGTLDDTWVWSGGAWTQKLVAGPPSRSESVMGINPTGSGVVLFGGNHLAGGATTILADTWTWNGLAWTQESPTTSPSARFEAVMASLHTVDVLFGGTPASGGADLADTWQWNGSDWSRLSPATSPSGRSHAVATGARTSATSSTVNMLLFGGSSSTADNDTWRFAP